MNKVGVVIVTFNRKDYLKKELFALLNQTVKISTILLVDNNSSDGTVEMLKDIEVINNSVPDSLVRSKWNDIEILFYRSSVNTGGSGGFHNGLKLILNESLNYIWVMDDDVLPANDCLERLLENIDENSQVCVPNRNTEGYVDDAVLGFNWNNPFKPVSYKKLMKIENEQSSIFVKDFAFEGPLFTVDIVKKIGASDKSYFIYFDDSDYAQKCLHHTKIKYIPTAHLYKQIIPSFVNGSINWKSYYYARNEIVFDKRYNKNKIVASIRPYISLGYRLIKYTIKGNKLAVKCYKKAFVDAKKNNLGKTISPGDF